MHLDKKESVSLWRHISLREQPTRSYSTKELTFKANTYSNIQSQHLLTCAEKQQESLRRERQNSSTIDHRVPSRLVPRLTLPLGCCREKCANQRKIFAKKKKWNPRGGRSDKFEISAVRYFITSDAVVFWLWRSRRNSILKEIAEKTHTHTHTPHHTHKHIITSTSTQKHTSTKTVLERKARSLREQGYEKRPNAAKPLTSRVCGVWHCGVRCVCTCSFLFFCLFVCLFVQFVSYCIIFLMLLFLDQKSCRRNSRISVFYSKISGLRFMTKEVWQSHTEVKRISHKLY